MKARRWAFVASVRAKAASGGDIEAWAEYIVMNIRYRARSKRLTFDLDLDWMLDKLKYGRCQVTNKEFDLRPSTSRRKNPWSPSVDRIDPNRGYTKDNCQLVSLIYNISKSNWTHDDVRELSKRVLFKGK